MGLDRAITESLPVVPLRDSVLFPGATIPLTIGNPTTLHMLQARRAPFEVMVVAQRNMDSVAPGFADLHEVGTMARIHRFTMGPQGTAMALAEGLVTARWLQPGQESPHLEAKVEVLGDLAPGDDAVRTMGEARRRRR